LQKNCVSHQQTIKFREDIFAPYTGMLRAGEHVRFTMVSNLNVSFWMHSFYDEFAQKCSLKEYSSWPLI